MKFDAPQFQTETEARKYIEALRWPSGRACPKCGSIGTEYETKREGRYRCGAKECRKDFTTITGTVMEASHIKLTVWLMAFYLMASSKKGMSAHQLHRTLDVTYKTAWFLAHRIRAAMRSGGLVGPLGGAGKVVEADETYYGKVENPLTTRTDGRAFTKGGVGTANKRAIVALVERGGSVRTFHVAEANRETVEKIVRENVHPDSRLHTERKPPLSARWQRVRRARNRQAHRWRVRTRRRSQQQRRSLLWRVQEGHARRLSALRRKAPAPLS